MDGAALGGAALLAACRKLDCHGQSDPTVRLGSIGRGVGHGDAEDFAIFGHRDDDVVLAFGCLLAQDGPGHRLADRKADVIDGFVVEASSPSRSSSHQASSSTDTAASVHNRLVGTATQGRLQPADMEHLQQVARSSGPKHHLRRRR